MGPIVARSELIMLKKLNLCLVRDPKKVKFIFRILLYIVKNFQPNYNCNVYAYMK